jgi:NAD(P)-dependent dehydrogenase (short-subunit alcohol dehydrogenase family)
VQGAKTVLVARRAELLNEVAEGIKSRGGEALPVPADLTHEEAVTALIGTAPACTIRRTAMSEDLSDLPPITDPRGNRGDGN